MIIEQPPTLANWVVALSIGLRRLLLYPVKLLSRNTIRAIWFLSGWLRFTFGAFFELVWLLPTIMAYSLYDDAIHGELFEQSHHDTETEPT